MNHSLMIRFCLIIIFAGLILSVPGFTQKSELPKNKQTELGLYATAQEAYARWKADPARNIIVDVRTPEEYVFIGHPDMAHNIPVMLLKEKWYAAKKGAMTANPQFIAQVKKKFEATDTLYLLCRGGGRSARAVNMLAKEGFKKVYTVTDGFEGGKVKNSHSYFNGKRMINGWRNSGSPWTYKVKPELSFLSVITDR